MQGFSVEMKCVETGVCNSNASWVYHFQLNITSFDTETSLATLLFTLGRAWAPSDGSGKPFNEFMDFNVTLYYVYVASPAKPAEESVDSFCIAATIFEPVGQQTRVVNGDFSSSRTLLGVTGFSWDLFQTNNILQLGRYFEAVYFTIEGINSQSATEVSYNVTIDILAPNPTTYAANLVHCLDVHAITLPGDVSVSNLNTANANICVNSDSATFKCLDVGMHEQETDSVPIHVALL